MLVAGAVPMARAKGLAQALEATGSQGGPAAHKFFRPWRAGLMVTLADGQSDHPNHLIWQK